MISETETFLNDGTPSMISSDKPIDFASFRFTNVSHFRADFPFKFVFSIELKLIALSVPFPILTLNCCIGSPLFKSKP